jgi:hypothetical protein
MSRKQPSKKKSEWVDTPSDHVYPSGEESTLIAGPRRFCVLRVFKHGSGQRYHLDCNLITSPSMTIERQALSATNMQQAKEEAIDMVRILLHHALSDL